VSNWTTTLVNIAFDGSVHFDMNPDRAVGLVTRVLSGCEPNRRLLGKRAWQLAR